MTKQYKGYYIDKVVFNSKKDIDTFIKNKIIAHAQILNNMMMSGRYSTEEMMTLSDMISKAESRLHNEFNMDYDSIECAIYA